MEKPSASLDQARWPLGILAAIFCIGAWLRLAHLGQPSLWWDEMIVALMGRYSPEYIMRWTQVFEPNPPYFHLFIKFASWISPSDTALRMGPALAGSLSIPLVFIVGKRLANVGAGLAAAALLAINPLHILISRQVRPYTLVVMFLLSALLFLHTYLVKEEKNRALWANIFCNMSALAFHYSSIVFLAAQSVPLWVLAARRRTRADTMLAVKHSLGLALAFLPVAPFFFPSVFARPDMVNAPASFTTLAHNSLRLIPELFVYFDGFVPNFDWLILAGSGVLFLVGLNEVLRASSISAGLLLSHIVTPFLMIIALRSNFLFSRYIFFVYIPCVLFQSVGLAKLLRNQKVAAVIALLLAFAGGLYIPSHFSLPFYAQDSYRHFGPGGTYKQEAQALNDMTSRDQHMVFVSEGFRQSLRWYAHPYLTPTPSDIQELSPGQTSVSLNFISDSDFAHLANDEADLFRRFGQPRQVRHFHRARCYSWDLKRVPLHRPEKLPKFYHFNAHPLNFVRNVSSARYVQVNPLWGESLIPTVNGQPASLEYSFAMPETQYPYRVLVEVAYSNSGRDNIFKVYSLFDGQEKLEYASKGPDSHGPLTLHLFRDAPFKTFSLKIEMTCAPETPNYPGSNLDSIQVREVVVGFDCAKQNGTAP